MSELKNMTIEASKNEKQRRRMIGGWGGKNRTSKNCGMTTKDMSNEYTRCRIKKRTEATFETIMMDNLPQINVRHQIIDLGN